MKSDIRVELDLLFEDQCNWSNCDNCIYNSSPDDDEYILNKEFCISCDKTPPWNYDCNFINYLIVTLKENKNLHHTELERLKLLYQIYKDAE